MSRGFGLIPLLNTISGRTKTLKNRVDLEHRVKAIKTAKKMFDDHFIMHMGIPYEKIDQFWFFCESDVNVERVIKEGNFENIVNFLTHKAVLFLKF